MKRPKYIEKLYASIFLGLAVAFILMGVLVYVGILKPTSYSKVQDPYIMASIFAAVGVCFWIFYAIAKTMEFMKSRLYKKLLADGKKITGKVEKIYMRRNIYVGKKSPYIITYSYKYHNENYRKKSYLLWEKPDVKVGEEITVYLNESGKSTLELESYVEK